ncbi:MAG: serine/threonine protein kinase [Rhodanobacteraceae bacterium]|nr:serine/threonine protein kinase [Rhodanobacteraceae bacterium]
MQTTTDALRSWFDRYRAVAQSERTAWLAAQPLDPALRGDLERLIAASEHSGVLDVPIGEWMLALEEDGGGDDAIGSEIGGYRLLRALGSGGMGAVYLAERADKDFQQQVAIKFLHRGLHTPQQRSLFRRERRILASLNHPNIARLIDGGVTDGTPYLVMEYVDGTAITEHCTRSAMPLRARLGLFVSVCRAVAAAHAALIVHRDIKPANVLVSATGEVKLLDFGIAKLLDDSDFATQTARALMTLVYASPEQRRGENVTTYSDVYSLGVLLHELLLGSRPDLEGLKARPSTQATTRPESEFECGRLPSPPAALARALRGDLDNILARALAPEPAARYDGAAALADDIERHLRGEPVSAHPPSRWYRLRKFVARHRLASAVTLTLTLATLLSLALALEQGRRARFEAEQARAQAQRATTVRDVLIDILETSSADLPANQKPTPEVLAAMAEKKVLADPLLAPELRADILLTLANIHLSQRALADAQRALDAARPLLADGDRLRHARLEAQRLLLDGEAERAAALLREWLPTLEAAPQPESGDALQTLAFIEWDLGDFDAALRLLQLAAKHLEQTHGVDSLRAIEAHADVANHYASRQQWAQTEALLTPLLQRWEALGLPLNSHFTNDLVQYGYALMGLGRNQEAEHALRRSLQLRQQIFVAPHDRIANSLSALGMLAIQQGDFAAAIEHRQASLGMREALFSDPHPLLVITRIQLAGSYLAARDFAAAQAQAERAAENCATPGFDHPYCAQTALLLARIALESEQLEAAARHAARARDQAIATYGEHGAEVGRPFLVLAQVAALRGERDAALAAFERGIAELKPQSAAGRAGRLLRADALLRLGDAAGAWQDIEALGANVSQLGAIDASRYWTLYAELGAIRGDAAAVEAARAAFESPLRDRDPAWIARREAMQR